MPMRRALETQGLWRAGSAAAAVVLASAPLEAQGPELAMLDSLTTIVQRGFFGAAA